MAARYREAVAAGSPFLSSSDTPLFLLAAQNPFILGKYSSVVKAIPVINHVGSSVGINFPMQSYSVRPTAKYRFAN